MRLTSRHVFNKFFRLLGAFAVLIACSFLALLILSICTKAYHSFWQARVNMCEIVKFQEFAEYKSQIIGFTTINHHKDNCWQVASDQVNSYLKETPRSDAPLDVFLYKLHSSNIIKLSPDFNIISHSDSRYPENAGILGGIIGSFLTMFICVILSFPIAILSAVYLEEFAVKNWTTKFIELNIANLAGVPSIVFGLLGLAMFISYAEFVRSSALVGGLTLALMALPTMIIITRQSLKIVPLSLKEAAMALGASKTQIVFHHTLPAVIPNIITGAILTISRVIGETAPLLMIGMSGFIVDLPMGVNDPATVMPMQIYLWSNIPEYGFGEKTAAGILILLVILAVFNIAAAYIRKKYEIKF